MTTHYKNSLTLDEWAALVELTRSWHPDAVAGLMSRLLAGAAPWKRRAKKGGR